jgi:hypothetical protein
MSANGRRTQRAPGWPRKLRVNYGGPACDDFTERKSSKAVRLAFANEVFDVVFMIPVLGEAPNRTAAIKVAARVLEMADVSRQRERQEIRIV